VCVKWVCIQVCVGYYVVFAAESVPVSQPHIMHRSYCVLCFRLRVFCILYLCMCAQVHIFLHQHLLIITQWLIWMYSHFVIILDHTWKNVVSSSHVDKILLSNSDHMQLFSCCLLCNVCSGCWVNVMWNVLLHVLWPPGLLVAPPRTSCLSHKARRWSWICTTRMIWPRKMRTWAGERWKIWWHSCNSLPQGGHHEQLISLYTWSVFMFLIANYICKFTIAKVFTLIKSETRLHYISKYWLYEIIERSWWDL